jgi:MurNAc alpha-1-phosphate uridylyltransferase
VSGVQTIVMAAGEGRRLRPLTERWAKPVLPIGGRPVLASLLRDLAAASLGPVTIVVGHLGHQLESLAGDGSAFGIAVRYAHQPEALGSADAVERALAAGAEAPCLVVAADNVFAPRDLGRFAEQALAAGTAGALAIRGGLAATPSKPGVRTRDGLVDSIVDTDPALRSTAAPLWFLGPDILPFLEGLPGPPFELREAYERAMREGFSISALEVAPTRDLTHPEDLVMENFPYAHAYE